MKIIITGATGRVGAGVLEECLARPEITSVIALSRRQPGVSNPKLEWIKHEDFTVYDPSVLSKIQGARSCVYCLGTNVPLKSPDENRKVNLDYALATAHVFAENLASTDFFEPFQFIYLSGALPEKDQSKTLWFLSDTRKMRGELENRLLHLNEDRGQSGFIVNIVRPGFVFADGSVLMCGVANLLANAIKQSYLCKAMAHIAASGLRQTIMENEDLIRIGKDCSLQA